MIALTYLSLGAGVQSGTLAEMIAEGELAPVDGAIFADTGDEPAGVYSYLDYLESRLARVGVPLIRIHKGNLVADIQEPRQSFASIPAFTRLNGTRGRLRRQCTVEYKIIPINKYIAGRLLELDQARADSLGRIRVNAGVTVDMLLGITLDELQRMKPNRRPWIRNVWPLIDLRMSRHDCLIWLEKHRLRIPSKSSCRVCPYHRDSYWRTMKEESPGDWDHVIKFDRFLRSDQAQIKARTKGELYLHESLIPLEDLDLSTPADHGQLDFFDVCDEGYCFI